MLSTTDVESIRFPFQPYKHQLAALNALDSGKNAVLVWHRRAGKDLTLLNFCITEAVRRAGTYFYLYPTYAQAKKVWWDGMTTDGIPYRDFLPKALILDTNETEMQIKVRTHDGRHSIIQAVGTDNINRIVGPNPIGAIYSEFSLHNPRAKALLDPIFAANKGWQAFAYTPRGKNHGWDLYDYAVKHPDKWYASQLTIRDTCTPDGKPIIEESYLDELRAQGQDEDLIQQEYYCSFEGSVQGSYYGRYLAQARADRTPRIGFFPWTSGIPVRTAWDIGRNDTNVVWFYQKVGQAIRLIDYYEDFGGGAEIYGKVVLEKPYVYEGHSLPWDADMETAAAPKCFRAQLQSLGLRNCRVVRKCSIETGISAVRRLFPRFQFNEGPCEDGIKALAFYHKEWDEDKQTFKPHPDHDWSSNAADAMRTLAMGESEWTEDRRVQTQYSTEFDAFKNVPDTYETEHDFLYDSREETYASRV